MSKTKGLMQAITVLKAVSEVATTKEGQKFLCGTYSNGKPRSAIDAWRDEFISPEDREYWEKKKRKKKKKGKKKKKKGKKGKNRYTSFYDMTWMP